MSSPLDLSERLRGTQRAQRLFELRIPSGGKGPLRFGEYEGRGLIVTWDWIGTGTIARNRGKTSVIEEYSLPHSYCFQATSRTFIRECRVINNYLWLVYLTGIIDWILRVGVPVNCRHVMSLENLRQPRPKEPTREEKQANPVIRWGLRRLGLKNCRYRYLAMVSFEPASLCFGSMSSLLIPFCSHETTSFCSGCGCVLLK